MPRTWVLTLGLECLLALSCSAKVPNTNLPAMPGRDTDVQQALGGLPGLAWSNRRVPLEAQLAEPELDTAANELNNAALSGVDPLSQVQHDADAGLLAADSDGGQPDFVGVRRATAGQHGPQSTKPGAHPFFATAYVEDRASMRELGEGDLWANCWSNDDALYVAAGDARGFGLPFRMDVIAARIDGTPTGATPMRGTTLAYGEAISSVWSGSQYNRKPTGMLCVDGDIYLAVQDLRLHTFSDAPAATIVRSHDKGRTWTWDRRQPMFADHKFTTIMFLDFGKDSEHAPRDVIYAYGIDDNWRFSSTRESPTQLYLARVPRDAVQVRARWEFFRGYDARGNPRWTTDINARVPVLEDRRRVYTAPLERAHQPQNMTVISQGGVLYNAPLRRYIYTSWTEYTFEFYEAPEPWGPWTHFLTKDFGVPPWNEERNGGYATTLPSKFVSRDGRSLWLQANAWGRAGVNKYGFTLRQLQLAPYATLEPNNERSQASLAQARYGAVPIGRTFRFGRPQYLNDGVTRNQSEDSWSGNTNLEDYWGYTWPQQLRVNKVRYTTGRMTSKGGWFEHLSVQIRRGRDWVPVTRLTIEPAYAKASTVPNYTTYTLRFDEAVTDGVRLVGTPGGNGRYTTVAELSVSYE